MGVTFRRTVEIAVRTAHVGAMALVVGGHHFSAASSSLRAWYVLTAVTGVALLASEASHSRHWIHQARGVLSLAHVGVIALVALAPAPVVLAAALIIGSIGSHLPRTVRKWSFRHRRVVD
jgi:hypothetical protein